METSVEENPWRLLEPVGDTTTMTTAEDHEESQVFKKIDPTKLNRLNLNGKTLNFHYFAGAARYFEKSVSSVTELSGWVVMGYRYPGTTEPLSLAAWC